MNRHIDVFAQLSLVSSNGTEITVHADKDIVSIVFPNFRAARQLLGQGPQRHERRKILDNLHQGLQLSDLKMYFKIAHFQVAQLTPQSQGGFVSRWLGLAPLKLHPLAVLRAIVSS
ncbi:MAG: hypothetical protein V2J55_08150 [Candidatus Competibacteraceae bacterium]|jgi:hypothetical protein|nr:hypothetical protein [Candidatus Competibacteraceae bacterium]